MKKMVNGKVVTIKQIELFEKAFEGLVLGAKASSNLKDTLDTGSELVKHCVEAGNKFLSALPFPLFAVETNCKYAFMANYIIDKVEDLKRDDVYVDGCIIIALDRNRVLKMLCNTWAIESRKEVKNPASLKLDDYIGDLGYDEFKWCYDRLIKDEGIRDYYKQFMPEFMSACGSIPVTFNWELNHILEFGHVPDEIEVPKNTIVDLNNSYRYFLDIYCCGKTRSHDTVMEIHSGGGKFSAKTSNKMMNAYDFDVYGKQVGEKGVVKEIDNKIEKKQLECAKSIFIELVREGITDDCVKDVKYTGLIVDDLLFFEIKGKMFMASAKEYTAMSKQIASRVSIYSYEGSKLYLKNTVRLESGVYKDSIYSYDRLSNVARLCRISFRQG